MSDGVMIQYGDIAPNAKENFSASSSESMFDTLENLKKNNLKTHNHANPCELYQTVLDGRATAFPSNPIDSNVGLWSVQTSKDNGSFSTPIVLTLESAGTYSAPGLTFTFDKYNEIYATMVTIQWYRVLDGKTTYLGGATFTPDRPEYYCKKQVDSFNKVVITFYSINMPKNRLKLQSIEYGHGFVFYGDELRNVNIIQEINPISSEIIINTADFTIDSKKDTEYSFQNKQPLSIYYNGKLKATTFVKAGVRKARFLWDVQSEDYLSLMDGMTFYGGIYNAKNAVELLDEIFSYKTGTEIVKIPYILDSVFANETVTGFIPICTRREALMQVAFAIQAVVDTSNSDSVKLFALEDKINQFIPAERIMQGQSFTDEETVTGVEVTVHSYEQPSEDERGEIVTVYNAKEDGLGQNIFVEFPEPLWDLQIRQNGEIVEKGDNYAIVNANSVWFKLGGYKYEHTTQTKSKKNELALAEDVENIKKITDATLVSSGNVDKVIDSCYNWLIKAKTANFKIVEGKHATSGGWSVYGKAVLGKSRYGSINVSDITYDQSTNVGEKIGYATEYLGNMNGLITKQSFNLNSNRVIKETVVK